MSSEFNGKIFPKIARILQKTLDKKYFFLTKESSNPLCEGPFSDGSTMKKR